MNQHTLPMALLRVKVEGTPLTPAEKATLRLIARGLTLEEVGRERGVSRETVRKTAKVARARLGARTNAHAVAIAVSLDLI